MVDSSPAVDGVIRGGWRRLGLQVASPGSGRRQLGFGAPLAGAAELRLIAGGSPGPRGMAPAFVAIFFELWVLWGDYIGCSGPQSEPEPPPAR